MAYRRFDNNNSIDSMGFFEEEGDDNDELMHASDDEDFSFDEEQEEAEEDPLLVEANHFTSGHSRCTAASPTTIVWTRQCTVTSNNHHFNNNNNDKTATAIFNAIPEDLLAYTACFLNVGSLKQARLVNRKWNRVLSTDEAGWKMHLHRLTQRRLHVYQVPAAQASLSAKDAYRMACADARLRHAVRREELIYDDTNTKSGTIWSFRFKQVAGAEWTQHDPWHAGREARKMVFLPNGTVRQYHDTARTLHPPFYDAPRLPGGLDIQWRFVTQPIDLPKKESGAYVRLTIAGRDVPTYMVHRSPTGNFGFLMENCWGLFSSFALPRRKNNTNDAAVNNPQPRAAAAPRMRLRRDAYGGARWLDVSQEESDEEEEEENDDEHCFHHDEDKVRHQDKNYLLEDASLSVTCRWQWREALLYNLGASILPDGPNASGDFDRAWQLSMRSMQSFGFPVAARQQEEPMDNV